MKKVTDPELLAKLEGSAHVVGGRKKVSDPALLEQLNSGAQTGPKWSDVPKNAMTDVKDLVGGLKSMADRLADIPPHIVDRIASGDFSGLGEDVLSGVRKTSEVVGAIPSAVVDRVRELTPGLGDPVKAFKEHPVKTALDVAPLVAPMAGAVRGEIPGLAEKVASAGKKAGAVSETVGKRALNAALGPSSEAIEARLANPSAIKNAVPSTALAERLPATMQKLQKQISEYDRLAWDTLKTSHDPLEGAISKAEIVKKIDRLKNDFRITGGGVAGESDARAVAKLDQIKSRVLDLGENVRGRLKSQQGADSLLKNRDYISERNLKEIIQSFDKDINYNDVLSGQTNKAISGVRQAVDDMLKGQNEAYKTAMVPVAERMDIFEAIPKQFSLERDATGAFSPKNSTATNLETASKEKTLASRKTLERLKSFTGENYLKDLENAKHAKQFEGGVTQGSRRTGPLTTVGTAAGGTIGGLLFGPAGAGAGGVIGGGVGYGLGSYLDVSGRRIAGDIIDRYAARAPRTPLAEVIMAASRRAPSGAMVPGGVQKALSGGSAIDGLLDVAEKTSSRAPSPAFQQVLQAAAPGNSGAEASGLTPDERAYQIGLEHFLNGDLDAADKAWAGSNLLEAQRGRERVAILKSRKRQPH